MTWKAVLSTIASVPALLAGVHGEACAQQIAVVTRLPQLKRVRVPWVALHLDASRIALPNAFAGPDCTNSRHADFGGGCVIHENRPSQQKPPPSFMVKELRAIDEFANPEKYASDGTPLVRVLPALIGPSYGITAKAVF